MAQEERREEMGGLSKGLAVIEAFRGRPSLTIADAARAAAVSRAAARRCLLTLARLGYVSEVERGFVPTEKMRFLGAAASVPIHILAQPELDKLRDGAGEPVSLAVLSGRHSLFVARAVVDRVVNTGVTLGQRVPLHCSATGQVLLSGLDEQHAQEALKAEPLERPTSRTLDKVSAIMKVVRAVKANGYALNDQELEIGLIAVAVPVFDREGSVAAAVSISSLTVRRSAREMVRTFVPQMVTCARNIGERLAPRTE